MRSGTKLSQFLRVLLPTLGILYNRMKILNVERAKNVVTLRLHVILYIISIL